MKNKKTNILSMEKATSELMKLDPLYEAEKKFGEGSEEANAAGFLLLQTKSKLMKKLLQSQDDTYYNMKSSEFIRVVKELGFNQVLHIPFVKDDTNRNYYLFWDNRGLLLSFDTYVWSHEKNETVNGANVYFNWRRNKSSKYWPEAASGGVPRICPEDDFVFSGHLDAREALAHKISQLSKEGAFLSQWMEQPFLYLIHNGDDSSKYHLINQERIAQLPEHVQKSIVVSSPWTLANILEGT